MKLSRIEGLILDILIPFPFTLMLFKPTNQTSPIAQYAFLGSRDPMSRYIKEEDVYSFAVWLGYEEELRLLLKGNGYDNP
jgi:hypothetical protein